jgi:hypothetical protein
MQDFEKQGQFYLGRSYDIATRKRGDEPILYDASDLVTHAVCVGMTGSGKTGLCMSLLEEALIDHIPAIAIDPKGDLSNLLLTFPALRGEDFAPWVDEGEAKNEGKTRAEFADAQAALWKKGLAEWGEDGARIQRLRDSGDFRIYTPGSQAGLPISILKSFAAPPPAIRDDPEALSDRVGATATSILALLGIDADPSQSREHILISNILGNAWKEGKDIDVAGLIPLIQNPPFGRVGVIETESFFPAKERFAFALKLNNLLAAPGFESWLQGEPLDIDAMFHSPGGKPRISIVSIAHLSDSDRMFFVSLLLNQVVSWVRTQTGTSSLRAILYMDEIFGYFPPVAMPPSKRPLLTLLKQARAYGLGVVLATQNPADLDYKGLSNTGTWFIGRLQAERDKLRVLDGLEGAAAAQSAGFDRQEMDRMLSGLGKRVFLLHNVHEDHPRVFQVRWALSYLRGPLTRQQIKQLMDPFKASVASPATDSTVAANAAGAAQAPAPAPSAQANGRPILPPEIPQFFLAPRGRPPASAKVLYRPMILGLGDVYFHDTKVGVSTTAPVALLATLSMDTEMVDWTEAERVEVSEDDLEREPDGPATFDPLPPIALKAKSYPSWTKSLVDALYRLETIELRKSPSLETWSNPGESEREFRTRLRPAADTARDEQLTRLRSKYASKLATLDDKIRRADQAIDREAAQARASWITTFLRFLTSILHALVGRKTLSASTINQAGSAIRNTGQSMKESSDLSRAKENAESLRQQKADLESQLESESSAVASKFDPAAETFETTVLRPKKTNITPKLVALTWVPYWSHATGTATPAWK